MEYIILGIVILAIFIGVIFLITKNKKKFDYITKHGIKVKLSKQLENLKKEDVELWTDDVVNFWFDKKEWAKLKSYNVIKNISIYLYDEIFIVRGGQKVNAMSFPDIYRIDMATLYKEELNSKLYTPYKKVRSLFRHEVSHFIAGYVGGVEFDNEIHHKLFQEVELGA